MKAILIILFSFILVNNYAQEKANIKTVTIYSLKDTAKINFKDSVEMSNWKWYKKSYNKSGKLVQEIQYPFPHNPLNGT